MGCIYCSCEDNGFIALNDTRIYSGIDLSLNRQGMLRARYYDDEDNLISEDIVNLAYCPNCGKRFDNGNS